MKKHARSGFTLVEVLIVVIIIAILAALILPRMTAQVEKAKAAEAFQMMGTMKRIAEREYSLTGSYGSKLIASDPGGTGVGNLGSWNAIGLKDLENSRSWGYYYYTFETGYEIYLQNAEGYFIDRYISYPSDREHWLCDGTFFDNKVPGDDSTPCILK